MIVRLVKLCIQENQTENFESIFRGSRSQILDFDGCLEVQLRRDVQQSDVFFTISHWRSEMDLENYRSSEVFIKIWRQVKPLFSQKAEAWTLK